MAKETGTELGIIAKPNVERSLLAMCIDNPDTLMEIKDQEVVANMFLIEANRYIFQAIEYLYSKKQDASPIAIMEVIADVYAKSKVEEFGGVEYLNILAEQRVNTANLEIFSEKLKQAYARYKIVTICDKSRMSMLQASAETLNPTEIIEVVGGQLTILSNTIEQTKEIYKMGDSAEFILEQRAENPNSIPGLEVGWNKFDYYTNGGQPGDLIIVVARAKTGKSALLTNWATKLAIKDKIPILYFDTEMDKRQQEDRILSILSGIPQKEIISGMYVLDTENGKADDKKKALEAAICELKEGNYYHIYTPNFTIDKITAICKKFKTQENIQAVFFDYLKFPSSQIANLKSTQEWQMLGYIASGLKDIAGTLEIPIYSAAQENRIDPKGGKKSEINVGGSDRILQLATKLVFLTNKQEEDILRAGIGYGNQTLYIAYQRNGESDAPPINVMFDKPRITLNEI